MAASVNDSATIADPGPSVTIPLAISVSDHATATDGGAIAIMGALVRVSDSAGVTERSLNFFFPQLDVAVSDSVGTLDVDNEGPLTPIVLTVGVNGISATGANLIGSVNPNGETTTAWFAWGTSPTLVGATTTTVTTIASSFVPVTLTDDLANLTPGTTYYVAIVAQNLSGQITGNIVSFVAIAPPVTITNTTVPYGQPSVTIPHFQVPFALTTTGLNQGAAVVEQDTSEEVLACVTAIVLCPLGGCPQIPSFGVPSLTFQQEPIDTTEFVAAIQAIEPRATESVISQLAGDGVSWSIALSTSTVATQFT